MKLQMTALRLLAGTTAFIAFEGFAHAQGAGGVPGPAVSPYVNLLRRGNTTYNYYGLVRPEVDFRNQMAGMQSQYNNLSQDIYSQNANQDVPMRMTGHGASFQNLSHYYGGGLRSGRVLTSGMAGAGGSGGMGGSALFGPAAGLVGYGGYGGYGGGTNDPQRNRPSGGGGGGGGGRRR